MKRYLIPKKLLLQSRCECGSYSARHYLVYKIKGKRFSFKRQWINYYKCSLCEKFINQLILSRWKRFDTANLFNWKLRN